MSDKAEKLGSLFLVVFSAGLTAQFASVGMVHGEQWLGAAVAVAGSLSLFVGVRLRPRPEREPAPVRVRD